MVAPAHRVVVLAFTCKAERTGDQLDAGRIDRNRESYRVIAVFFVDGSRGQYDHVVHEHSPGGMCFGAANDDAVRSALHDADIVVGMCLLGRHEATVTFGVSLRHGQAEITGSTLGMVCLNTFQVVRAEFFVHTAGVQCQGEQGI